MRFVIIGSGFAGLNAAIKMKKKLKQSEHDVIVISEKDEFVFRPSLIWIPFHEHDIKNFTFLLRPTYDKIGVTFIENQVQALYPKQNQVICQNDEIIEYDYLIIATGASPDWAKIEGLETRSLAVYDLASALETKNKIESLTEGDPIVIGIAEDNPNPGIAYEFLFELNDYLDKRHIRCPITFFTYEKELYDENGSEASEKLEQLMADKQISTYRDVSIDQVDHNRIYLDNGEQLSYALLFALPPYKGKEYIFSSDDLEHKNGILPVYDTLQSVEWENIYVAGDGNNKSGIKTGRAAELQGVHVAKNIIKQMNDEPLEYFENEILYLMELGKDGAMFVMNKPIAQGSLKWTISGLIPHMMKRAFEKYYMLRFS